MHEDPRSPSDAPPIPPFVGDIAAEVVHVAPVSIHSDVYYDLILRHAPDSDQGLRIRAPAHACPRPPKPGDRVRISLLLGQVSALTYER